MYTISALGLTDGFIKTARVLKEKGQSVHVRGLNTKELHPCLIELENPCDRTLILPKRGNNPFASLAETMWVLASRSDMEWLSKFLPRCVDYSDDGRVWRAGYGPRMRNWQGYDQIKFVQAQLLKDSACRQAIISIWDPALEVPLQKQGTKDWPCSNWIHFMIRNEALDCTVVMRSNDFVFGWSGINVYEWTVLQEILAKSLGLKVGKYYHLSDSMHVYEQHYDKLDQILENINGETELDWKEMTEFKFGELDEQQEPFMKNVKDPDNDEVFWLDTYLNETEILCHSIEKGDVNSYTFKDLFYVNKILDYYLIADKTLSNHETFLDTLPFTDLKVAIDYWCQKNLFKRKDTGDILIQECIDRCAKVK